MTLSSGMAKSYCGFVPQNLRVMEQWGVMEASAKDILNALKFLPPADESDPPDWSDDIDPFKGWPKEPE